MGVLRVVLMIIGILAFAIGVLWIGQGTGYIPWPKQSFMINEMVWAYRGIGVAVAGLILILIARRIKGTRRSFS